MATNKNKKQIQHAWPLWRLLLTGLNIIALVISVILSWHYFEGGSMIGCGGGSPCDNVLNSQWSVIAGILPISGLAVGIYLALLVASFFIGPATEESIRHLAWSIMLILAGSIAGSAIWFTILQKWFIGDFCPYCMTAHISGMLIAIIVIWKKPFTHTLSAIRLALIGLVLAGILATGQLVFKPSTVYRDGESQNNLPAIDFQSVPMVGSPDAPYIVTLLFDYQCSHCQKIHFMLNEAMQRYNGKLAFVLCPAPLNKQCNPYVTGDVDAFKNSCELAKISLAVWSSKPEAFPDFENWMFTFESGDRWRPRSLENTRTKAIELLGQVKFDAALSDPWVEQYMQNCIQIYGKTIQNGQGGVPKLIFGPRWVVPELYDTDDLIMVLQNSLAVPRP